MSSFILYYPNLLNLDNEGLDVEFISNNENTKPSFDQDFLKLITIFLEYNQEFKDLVTKIFKERFQNIKDWEICKKKLLEWLDFQLDDPSDKKDY